MTSKTRFAKIQPYSGPAGGWDSAKSVAGITLKEHVALRGPELLSTTSQPFSTQLSGGGGLSGNQGEPYRLDCAVS